MASLNKPAAGDDMVPRQLLLDSQESEKRLKRQLQESLANAQVGVAVNTLQAQLRAVQKQQKTTEEQLNRSLSRERDLREQVVSSDVMTIMGQLRRENKELRSQNETLSEQATRGQESEAQLIVTRNKLEAAREEVLRVRAGNELEVQATRDELQSLKKALEEAKIDGIRSEQMVAARREMQETIDRSAEMLNERDRQILELLEERDKANAARTASDLEARTTAAKVAELERELRKEQGRVEEATVLQTETEKSSAKHLSTIMGLEEQLAHAQDSLTKIADRLKETEVELSSVHGDLRSLQNSSARDSSSLAAQLKDAQSRLEELRESSSRAEEEHSAAREAFRQELHKAESEGKHLRDVLRKERDLLEKLMRDQSGKDSEHTEQRQRIEDQASRRELALQTRLQSTEKELDALRRSSVPETQLRKLQVQFDSEREQFERRLETALQDACRAQQQKTVGLRELEQQRLALSSEVDIAGSKIRSLEVKLQEAEEACASERKARLLVADQLRVYKGEGSLQRAGDDRRLTKVAQAAMESVGNAVHIFETIEKGLMNPVANSLDGQQRSALGIAVVDSIVEETIPGSPAAVCGLISAGDEIVAVNGKAVQGSGVAAALRGDDMIGGVVSVTVRKRSSELLEVHLPRADIAVVSGRRQLCDDLAEFSVQAVQAAQAHQPEVLSNRLENILASMKALEQLDVTVQYKLSMQVAELTKGFHEAIKSAFRGIEQVDHVHQQAHALQEQTEEDLRAKLAQRDATMDNANGPTMGAQASEVSGLHAENQSLGRDFRQVQNELKARNMQLADCKRDTDRLREALLMAEEKAAMFEEGQKAMRGTLSAMEEELADAVAEFVEFSFAIAVGINLLWDENMRDAASRRTFDSQLTEDVAWALRIPKNAVSSICYHREDDQVVVVLKLCNVIPPGGTMQNGLRTSRALADEFEQQILDMNSQLRRRPLGAYTKDCTLLGPVSEMTVKAINMSRLDEERDADWRQDEVLRLREQLKRAEDRAKQASELNSKEEEARRLENLDLDLSHKKSQATQEEAQHQAMVAQQNLLRQHQVELTELKRKHKLDLEDWERAMKTKDYEISVLKEQMVSDEIRNSAFKSEKDKGFEFARSVQDAYHKLQMASAQMRDLMKPEINACINTLNNVESEMAFFNAHQVRVLQIATSMSGTSLEDTPLCKDQADAAKSKELVQHDIDALRKQLEALAELTAANGELASQFKLPRLASTAHMTPSRAGERCASGGETPVPVSPVFLSASRRLALGDNEAFAVSGAVVALQNVPTAELEGNHVSMAVSLLPASADPNAFEHILPGSSDLSPRRSFIPFMGNTPRRGKTGKQLTFITPQHRTASMQIQGSSWSWLPEQFCLGEQHRLQAADFSSGGEQEGSQGPRRDAMSLDGGMATLLVTLMAGGDGEVPRAYARCVVTVMSGDDVDKWYTLEDLNGTIVSDANAPSSIRLRAKYLGEGANGGSATPTGDQSASVLWKAKDGTYVC